MTASIAVVGAGPAGCYTAQALRKKMPAAEIVVFDRLPVPYGLLRYGVAADHQGTKAVSAQFERLFVRGGVEFRGGVSVGDAENGADLTLAELRDAFDAVVLATGLALDRGLGVPGGELGGVIGSGRLTRALNSHPDETSQLPVVGARVAIVGGGNIAADVIRLLLRGSEEWDGSDMDPEVFERVVPSAIERIDVVVRSDADNARWDAAMVRELGGLERAGFRHATGSLGDLEAPRAAAVAELLGGKRQGDAEVVFHFGVEVDSIEASETGEDVVGLRMRTRGDAVSTLDVDTVVTAIGFEPFEAELPSGVYAAGWLATGPRGTIPQQRALGQQLAARIAEHLGSRAATTAKPGLSVLSLREATDYAAWQRIDSVEISRAPAKRVRRKLSSIRALRAATVIEE